MAGVGLGTGVVAGAGDGSAATGSELADAPSTTAAAKAATNCDAFGTRNVHADMYATVVARPSAKGVFE